MSLGPGEARCAGGEPKEALELKSREEEDKRLLPVRRSVSASATACGSKVTFTAPSMERPNGSSSEESLSSALFDGVPCHDLEPCRAGDWEPGVVTGEGTPPPPLLEDAVEAAMEEVTRGAL